MEKEIAAVLESDEVMNELLSVITSQPLSNLLQYLGLRNHFHSLIRGALKDKNTCEQVNPTNPDDHRELVRVDSTCATDRFAGFCSQLSRSNVLLTPHSVHALTPSMNTIAFKGPALIHLHNPSAVTLSITVGDFLCTLSESNHFLLIDDERSHELKVHWPNDYVQGRPLHLCVNSE